MLVGVHLNPSRETAGKWNPPSSLGQPRGSLADLVAKSIFVTNAGGTTWLERQPPNEGLLKVADSISACLCRKATVVAQKKTFLRSCRHVVSPDCGECRWNYITDNDEVPGFDSRAVHQNDLWGRSSRDRARVSSPLSSQ